MNKTLRNFLIAGAAVFAAGAVVFVIGMSALKWDFSRLDATEYKHCAYSAAESGDSVTAAEIDVQSFGVVIESGDGIALDYYEASDSEVTVGVENGVLKITEKQKPASWFTRGAFSFGRIKYKYVLTVPSGLPLNVKGATAEITMNSIETEKLDIDCTNLSMTFSDCTVSSLKINSTNLHVSFVNTEVSEFRANSTNNNIKARGSRLNSIVADGTNVDFDFVDTECGTVISDGTNVKFVFDSVKVDKVTLSGTNVNAKLGIKGDRREYTVVNDGEIQQTGNTDKRLSFDGTNVRLELNFI